MKVRSGLAQGVGGLALAGMVLLSSPGIRVARAEPGESVLATPVASSAGLPSSSREGVCRVGESDVAQQRAVRGAAISAQVAERLRQELLSGDGESVVLNGRGYNYRRDTNPVAALALIEAEAKRQGTRAAH